MKYKQTFTKKEIKEFKELEEVFKEGERIGKEMYKNNSKVEKELHNALKNT